MKQSFCVSQIAAVLLACAILAAASSTTAAADALAPLKAARASTNDETFTKGLDRPSQWGQRLNLSCSAVTDAGLVRLGKYNQLSRLDLGYNGLAEVAKFPSLSAFHACQTRITDRGVRHLQSLEKLAVLGLADTPVGDDAVACLAAMPQLRSIDLSRTLVTDAGLMALKDCSALEWIGLNGCALSPAAVQELKRSLPNLSLDLSIDSSPSPAPK